MLGSSKFAIGILLLFRIVHGWKWVCYDSLCTRTRASGRHQNVYPTLDICNLACGNSETLNIWPYPTVNVFASKQIVYVDPENINFNINCPLESRSFLEKNVKYFREKFNNTWFNCQRSVYSMNVSLKPSSCSTSLNIKTDESYSLEIDLNNNELKAEIRGSTVFGVRHGMETLLQLLVPFEDAKDKCLATLETVKVEDEPTYPHRGLLLDTARNYLSLGIIKKNIDAMAASKLNVLHWHITDSQSFPLESPSLPNMTKYGAYSPTMIYTPEDIEDLVDYAKIRGIKILMEIDGPSHVGNGWQWGKKAGLGQLALCVNQQPWRSFCIQPPCGQLNPINPNVYKVLNALYKDVNRVVPDSDLFHLGGDEVFLGCWNKSQEIIDSLKGKNLSSDEPFLDLWGQYQDKALAAYDSAVGHNKTTAVIWTSRLTQPEVIEKYLPKDRYIIQAWIPQAQNDLIASILALGYRMILSTKDRWYLDHGFWGTTRYYNWRAVYDNRMFNESHSGILGGEVCMWGELVDDSNIEPKVWPRAAAAAERLWTDPEDTSAKAEVRFFSHTDRLVRRGIKAEAPTPRWCIQNEGGCKTYVL